MRLRWKIGVGSYVETYEHRLVVGARPGRHVHHRNHEKADNSASNLVELTPAEHRRHHRRFDRAEAKSLYEAGLSPAAIGARIGVDGSNVYRALRREGVPLRPMGWAHRAEIDRAEVERLHAAGFRPGAIAAEMGSTVDVARRRMREWGLPSFPAGRPRS